MNTYEFLFAQQMITLIIQTMTSKDSQNNPDPERLNLKSIQSPDKIQPQVLQQKTTKNRARPQLPEKDKVKKRRKLLSFGDQIQDFQGDESKDVIKKSKNIHKVIATKQQNILDNANNSNKNLEERLQKQFLDKTQNLKQEMFQIDYSYWDGTSIVKKLKRKKKQTIENLLEICRLELTQHFQDLALLKSTELLFIVKDFIVPHNIKMCDIQALQLKTAKGENLFNFKNVKIKDFVLSVNIDDPVRIIQKSKYQKYINNYPFSTWRTVNLS